jgi:hypothetical protein
MPIREMRCPYGQPGDRLWVREKHRVSLCGDLPVIDYAATCETDDPCGHPIRFDQYRSLEQKVGPARWRSPIHMPRWASRITLEITGVRVERVQEITEADAIAEGVAVATVGNVGWLGPDAPEGAGYSYVRGFAAHWDTLNVPQWAVNPWVWVVEFRRLAPDPDLAHH